MISCIPGLPYHNWQFYNSWWTEKPNHQLSWVPKFVSSSSTYLHFIMIPVLLVLGWCFQTRHRWGMDVLRPRAVYPVVVQWKIAACSNNGNLGFLRTSSAHRIATVPNWVPFRVPGSPGDLFVDWVPFRSPFLSQGPLFLHFRLKDA